METTALYWAACSIAKLRVGCTELGWTPGVPWIVIRVRFHWATDWPDPAASAIPTAAGPGAVPPPAVWTSTGIAIPATTTAAVAVTSTLVVLRIECPADRVGRRGVGPVPGAGTCLARTYKHDRQRGRVHHRGAPDTVGRRCNRATY